MGEVVTQKLKGEKSMNITCEFCGSYVDTDSSGNRCPICHNRINFKTQVQKIRREMEEKEKNTA